MTGTLMHGGVKVYRGSPAAARAYVEADRSRVDDYYLAEGTGIAEHLIAGPDVVHQAAAMDGNTYEKWVAGYDLDTGKTKGRLRNDENAVRFIEVTVNGPKSWSLAAALHPDIAQAYDRAQDAGARQITAWLADHATTRVGPRGRQVQVAVERLEVAVVRHYTSRAGDPHRHLHLQISSRVWAHGGWRGLHTVGVRDSLEAINGIGHAAVMCDPGFRTALAAHGYHLDTTPDVGTAGEIVQLAPFVAAFSARAAQISRNADRYETAWRAEHPGEEPGPRLRRSWDARAWADARPDKVIPRDGAELERAWRDELTTQGFVPPWASTRTPQVGRPVMDTGQVKELVQVLLSRLGARRSAWNNADIRGEVERQIAATGQILPAADRTALAEGLTTALTSACVPLLDRDDVPEHVRHLTSPHVLDVEAGLTKFFAERGSRLPKPHQPPAKWLHGLDPTQQRVIAATTGSSNTSNLVVVEGAAGAGKTTLLAAMRRAYETQGHRILVVTPTLKAARVAARQVGTAATSAAKLAHDYGFRWDDDGHWTRVTPPSMPYGADHGELSLYPWDCLVVDEAGMLDQDTARALVAIAKETGAKVVLMGDRHQLPAVGRGGVLDLAAKWVHPSACLTLDRVHRFTDPDYAALSLQMRTGEHSGGVFDQLLNRGQVVIHPSDVERLQALAATATDTQVERSRPGTAESPGLVLVDTREQRKLLNAAIQEQLVIAGHVDSERGLLTSAGDYLHVGDRVATRRNDRDLGVANRETWTIDALTPDGGLAVTSGRGERALERVLPAEYATKHVELAYASTVHSAQGETVTTAHALIGEETTAAGAYVAMTRGRETNIAHLVAETPRHAREQWIRVFGNDRADLGPAAAAEAAAEAIERHGPRRPGQQRRSEERPAAPPGAHLQPEAPARDRGPIR